MKIVTSTFDSTLMKTRYREPSCPRALCAHVRTIPCHLQSLAPTSARATNLAPHSVPTPVPAAYPHTTTPTYALAHTQTALCTQAFIIFSHPHAPRCLLPRTLTGFNLFQIPKIFINCLPDGQSSPTSFGLYIHQYGHVCKRPWAEIPNETHMCTLPLHADTHSCLHASKDCFHSSAPHLPWLTRASRSLSFFTGTQSLPTSGSDTGM